MANAAITKGSTVEVSINEPGFHGAWYVATVVAEFKASPTKKRPSNKQNRNRKKIRYLVKYDMLLKEGSLDEPLTEIIDHSFVRPSPPRNLRRDYDGVAAEDGDGGGDFEVCDVIDAYHREGWWIGVVKKVISEGDLKKYIVLFENPHEEVEFQRCQLRLHADWIGGRWRVQPKKTPEQELNATHTSTDAHSGFATPSKRDLTADINNRTVDPQLSAKKKIRLMKNTESMSKMVDAVDTSVSSSMNKRIMNPVEEEHSHGKRFKSSAGGKGKTKVKKSGSNAIHQNSPLTEHEMTATERKSGRPPKSLAKRPISLLEGGHEITTDLDERPLSPPSASSCHRDESLNQATVTGGSTIDYQKEWPFIKRSPAWSTILSQGLYQTPPQKPDFSPLKKTKEDQREGVAVAMMVTFGNLVHSLSDLQSTDPIDIINDKLETLAELETYGFDVGAMRGRLNELLTLKSKVGPLVDKLKIVEEEIEKCNREKCQEEKEMNELEVKMQELQEKMALLLAMKKVKGEEIVKLQSNLHVVAEQISDWELAYKKLAVTPLICK